MADEEYRMSPPHCHVGVLKKTTQAKKIDTSTLPRHRHRGKVGRYHFSKALLCCVKGC